MDWMDLRLRHVYVPQWAGCVFMVSRDTYLGKTIGDTGNDY